MCFSQQRVRRSFMSQETLKLFLNLQHLHRSCIRQGAPSHLQLQIDTFECTGEPAPVLSSPLCSDRPRITAHVLLWLVVMFRGRRQALGGGPGRGPQGRHPGNSCLGG